MHNFNFATGTINKLDSALRYRYNLQIIEDYTYKNIK